MSIWTIFYLFIYFFNVHSKLNELKSCRRCYSRTLRRQSIFLFVLRWSSPSISDQVHLKNEDEKKTTHNYEYLRASVWVYADEGIWMKKNKDKKLTHTHKNVKCTHHLKECGQRKHINAVCFARHFSLVFFLLLSFSSGEKSKFIFQL